MQGMPGTPPGKWRGFGVLVGVLAASLLAGCASRRVVRPEKAAPERFGASLARGLSRDEPISETAKLVVFSDSKAVGVDPSSGEKTWERPIRAFGQPATFGNLVVLGVAGNKVLCLDAETGRIVWQANLPGQALTGLAISERWVVVTTLATEQEQAKVGARSVVVAYGANTGRRRWIRYSGRLLGVPAAAGRFGFVPTGDEVLALSLRSGRVLSRLSPAHDIGFSRVERSGGTLLAGAGDQFVDLADGGSTLYEVQAGPHRDVFEGVQGMDPGMGHDDGIAFKLLPAAGAGAPRNALFVGRRAIFFLRLDGKGRPVTARWVHTRYDQHEYVAVHPTRSVVLAVREDGAVVHIDRRSGRVREQFDGHVRPMGAAFVGRAPPVDDSESPVDNETMVATLVGLVEDPDPRLVPAQRLAIDLLWRNDEPLIRQQVTDLALGIVRPAGDDASEALRKHASTRVKTPWGRADAESLDLLLDRLGGNRKPDTKLTELVDEAVAAGSPKVVPKLVSLLNDPALRADELVSVAKALRNLSDARALKGTSDFIIRYHADPDIVGESKAIFYALELVIAHAQPEIPQRVEDEDRATAQLILSELLADEFTVPEVRAFIDANTQSGGAGANTDEEPDDPAAPGSAIPELEEEP